MDDKDHIRIPTDHKSVTDLLEALTVEINGLGFDPVDTAKMLFFEGLFDVEELPISRRERLRELYYLNWAVTDAMARLFEDVDKEVSAAIWDAHPPKPDNTDEVDAA